jgi:hypothetical protein
MRGFGQDELQVPQSHRSGTDDCEISVREHGFDVLDGHVTVAMKVGQQAALCLCFPEVLPTLAAPADR